MPESPDSTTRLIRQVELLADALQLRLLPQELPEVVQSYATLQAIAQALLRFPLPQELESAEVFEP